MKVISLTTDFGLRDWFVGTMKGVIARLAPETRVIDLTHDLGPGEIHAAAFALNAGYRYFPKKTIHVVVVDPGVGGPRRGLAVRTRDYTFVGPDNGVLSLALKREDLREIRVLTEPDYFLRPVSRTFHGRDIFAPVAAHLSCGVPLRRLGPAVSDLTRLDWPEPSREPDGVSGEVVYVDRFGNGITNLPGEFAEGLRGGKCIVQSRRLRICALAEFYQAVPRNQGVAVVGSSGLVEIAVNGGSAQAQMGLRIGTRVRLRAG